MSSTIDVDVPRKTGGACGGFLKAPGAIDDVVVGGLVKDDLDTTSFTVRGLKSSQSAENLAEKRRGDAKIKVMPTNSKSGNKTFLRTLEGASLNLIAGLVRSLLYTSSRL